MTVAAPGIRPPSVIPSPHLSFPRKRESTPGLSAVRDKPGFWIPAYAGMTVAAPGIRPSSVIPAPIRHSRPHPSFPRKRESTSRPIRSPGYTGVLDSGLRRNDGMIPEERDIAGQVWIPAFAGMTKEGGGNDGADKAAMLPDEHQPSIRKSPPSAEGGLGGLPRPPQRPTPEESVAPPPSFQRRPESRTPAYPGLRVGRGWIPAFAGMTKRGRE